MAAMSSRRHRWRRAAAARWCGAFVVGLIVLGVTAPPGLARGQGRAPIEAVNIERALVAGRPVFVSNRVVEGSLRFPSQVRAPVTLHGVTVTGRIYASSTAFERLADFSASKLRGGADFSGASFGGPAVFRGLRTGRGEATRFDFAAFSSSALFGGSSFGGTVTFRVAHFARLADFSAASFDDTADFADGVFYKRADFSAAEFHSGADFSAAEFMGEASFATVRFSNFATFIGAAFGVQTNAPVTFATARFDSGATFLDTEFNGPANFNLIESPSDVVFDGTEFDGDVSFSTATLSGTTSFSRARIYSLLNFDQAALNKLDLDGLVFEAASAVVALPQPKASTAHLQELRFDPADAGHIGLGKNVATIKLREDALSLLEAAALHGGDARAANQAKLERRTMIRNHNEWFPLNVGDYVMAWGIGGYLVRPWHQVITVSVLLALLTAVRMRKWRGTRGGMKWRRYLWKAFVRSWSAFWKLKVREGTACAQIEATVYTLLIATFLLNLANVWPTGNELLKGILG